jgi:hypothetical protein
MNGKVPCQAALVFVILSVVLPRMASAGDWTWMHIGNICGTVFLSIQSSVSYGYIKKVPCCIPDFPGFWPAVAVVPILCLLRKT